MTDSGTFVRSLSEELVEGRRRLEMDEAVWMDSLAEFDRDQWWSLDGALTAADWLGAHCKMGRSTAYEKLRIAHELARRPELAAAFRAGELSYSHIRLITRIGDPLGDTDAILLQVAKEGSVRQLEYCIRHYQLRAEQDLPPPRDRVAQDGAFVREVAPGKDQLCLTLPKEEMNEVVAAIDAFLDRSAQDNDEDREFRLRWDLRRAEAIKEMARAAIASAGRRAEGADRYMTHVVISLDDLLSDKPSVARTIDGTPIVADVARRIACDSTIVTQFVRNGFEVLDLGRKTKSFSDAQKRAMHARDQHRCRIPGCERTYVDCHHIQWASDGGPTDICNGICCCPRHHTLIHKGVIHVSGDANGTVTVRRSDGSVIGYSSPPAVFPVA